MTVSVTSKVNPALHALLVTAGTGLIADALTRLHAAAQAGGAAAGLAAIAIAVISWAQHSRQVAAITHSIELDASNLVTPGVLSRVGQIEQLVASNAATISAAENVVKSLPIVAETTKAVEDRVQALESKLPEPVKVAIEDVRPLVESAFKDLWGAIVTAPVPNVTAVTSAPTPLVVINTAPASDSLVDLAAVPSNPAP